MCVYSCVYECAYVYACVWVCAHCNTRRAYIECIYIYIYIVILFWWSPFIPSRNLDEVFTYTHI